jgi:hypothetical protein
VAQVDKPAVAGKIRIFQLKYGFLFYKDYPGPAGHPHYRLKRPGSG